MFGNDRIGMKAADYRGRFGDRAIARLDDDISRAIGQADWDDCRLLQSARLRLRRVELYEQIAARIALCRKENRPFSRGQALSSNGLNAISALRG